jgi:SAM-dependent methyltransferase
MSDYALSEADYRARERLDAVAASMDPSTIRYLEDLGVAPGWRCAEIGGGTGTIADWLANRIGPHGHLLATDLDTRWLEMLGRDNVEVLRHDIGHETLESSAFDLVHARYVLTHVPRWREALRHMTDALRPDGWLCLEEPDWITSGLSDPPTPAIQGFWAALGELVVARGGDTYVGRRVGTALHELGLADIGGDARAVVARDAFGPQLDEIGPVLIAAGLLSAEELTAAQREAATPGVTYTPLLVCIWGRRAIA